MKCRYQVCCTWSLLLAVDIQKHTCHLMRQGAIQHLPHNLHNSGWWRILFLVDDQWWKSNYAARSSHHSMELESIDVWKTSFLCRCRRRWTRVREPQKHLCKELRVPATKEIILILPITVESGSLVSLLFFRMRCSTVSESKASSFKGALSRGFRRFLV